MNPASRNSIFGGPPPSISNGGVYRDDGNSGTNSSSIGVSWGNVGFGVGFCLGRGGGGGASTTATRTFCDNSNFNNLHIPSVAVGGGAASTRTSTTSSEVDVEADVEEDVEVEVAVAGEDPSILLAQELSKLSYHERNQIMEEIHGVVEDAQHCYPTHTRQQQRDHHRNNNTSAAEAAMSLASASRRDRLEDDPHYINDCIQKMKQMIKNLQQNDTSKGSSGGKQQQQGGGDGGRSDTTTTSTTTSKGGSHKNFYDAYNKACFLAPTKYQDNRAFFLMFLRSTSFNIKAAVHKMIEYFNYKVKLFGWEKVAKDITLDDLDEDDMEALKSGASVFLPYPDTAGRAVCLTVLKHVIAKKWENQVCQTTTKNLSRFLFLYSSILCAPRPFLFCFPLNLLYIPFNFLRFSCNNTLVGSSQLVQRDDYSTR